ncbi:MAG: SGNH/GDSL hydrolase family protein [Patescibacteria group bacterium]|nr:SGNH/GDSL hydrolase family protein [Patescibacteria group bacterium]
MAYYIIFGDSIGCGEGDPAGGWTKLLSQKKLVKNLSIDGGTTDDYVKNFPTEIDINSTIIIALGVNDSVMIPLEKYNNNLLQLIKLVQKFTSNIVFVGPAPVDQVKVDPVPWHPEISYKTNLVQQFSHVMGQVARKEKLKFIDLFNQLPPEYIKTLEDGVHPNHSGHQMIFDLVKLQL